MQFVQQFESHRIREPNELVWNSLKNDIQHLGLSLGACGQIQLPNTQQPHHHRTYRWLENFDMELEKIWKEMAKLWLERDDYKRGTGWYHSIWEGFCGDLALKFTISVKKSDVRIHTTFLSNKESDKIEI